MEKIKFYHTLLFKMLVIFLITSLVPAIMVIGFIPQYYSKIITENTTLLTNSVAESVVTNIKVYVDDLKRLLVVPYMNEKIMNSIYTLKNGFGGKDISEKEMLEAQNVLRSTIPSYTQYARNDVYGTLLCFDTENVLAVYRDRSSVVDGFDFGKESWYQNAWEGNGKTIFISAHPLKYLEHQTDRQVFSVARLIVDFDTKKPLAIMKIDVDENLLSTIMENVQLNVSSIMAVVDNDGTVLYTNKPVDEGFKELLGKEQETVSFEEQSYQITSYDMKETGWKIKVLISKTEYMQSMYKMQITVIVFYLVAFSIAVLVFLWLSDRITRPLKVISEKMREVENGNFNVHFHVRKKDEIARLGHAFNIMTDRLNILVNQKYKAVIAAQKAEYYALQSQIEPHFLYNVLNSMVGINRMGDRRLLEKTITSLAGMLRYMTRQQDKVKISEAFEVVETYCGLQKLRLQKRLEYSIWAQEEVMEFEIPKLLVQPLVENAVIHGIEPTGETGRVDIRAYCERDMLYIDIEDTGCGFDLTEAAHKKGSVGIANVIDRLQFLGKEAKADIDTRPGEGCRIKIIIPMYAETQGEEEV